MTEQGAVLAGHYNYFVVVVSGAIAMLSAQPPPIFQSASSGNRVDGVSNRHRLR
jgi:hypothetical protein